MTPEAQAYIDAKFVANYWNQVAMLALLGVILVSKVLIYLQLVKLFHVTFRMLEEQRVQHTQHDVTHAKLDRGTNQLERKVETIPDAVVAKIADAGSPSAGDGDLPRPTLP